MLRGILEIGEREIQVEVPARGRGRIIEAEEKREESEAVQEERREEVVNIRG